LALGNLTRTDQMKITTSPCISTPPVVLPVDAERFQERTVVLKGGLLNWNHLPGL
jgi:hypothetical protein